MPLPGIGPTPDRGTLTLTPGSYSDLVASTLGNMGTDGDALDQSSQALAALMSAYEADVLADTLTDSLPKGSVFAATIAELAALGVEIDMDQEMQGISDALGALSIGISVLDILQQWLKQFFRWGSIIAQDISIIASSSGGGNIFGIPIGGGGPLG